MSEGILDVLQELKQLGAIGPAPAPSPAPIPPSPPSPPEPPKEDTRGPHMIELCERAMATLQKMGRAQEEGQRDLFAVFEEMRDLWADIATAAPTETVTVDVEESKAKGPHGLSPPVETSATEIAIPVVEGPIEVPQQIEQVMRGLAPEVSAIDELLVKMQQEGHKFPRLETIEDDEELYPEPGSVGGGTPWRGESPQPGPNGPAVREVRAEVPHRGPGVSGDSVGADSALARAAAAHRARTDAPAAPGGAAEETGTAH